MRIRDLYPESGRLLLTGGGKDFIERIGAEAAKQVVIGVLQGENIRSQTEPLTRRRVAQVSGAMIALFARGHAEVEDFSQRLSELALEQIEASRSSDNASIWPAQWLVGLTGKSVQNVLRSDAEARERYLADFEVAITEAADKCRAEFGDIRISLGFVEDQEGRRRELDWKAVTQLTTAIGSATLTIRGSDKSMYGKLFERLVLGSVLTLLGFERVEKETNTRREKVFWLSDSSSARECDATVLIKPGLVARFDIGFIGKGNPEIMKDKLSRFASHVELYGESHASKTFIIVDRMPDTLKTRGEAVRAQAEIVQMSMKYWPKELALRLEERLNYSHPLVNMTDQAAHDYIASALSSVPIQNFLDTVRPIELEADASLPDAASEMEAFDDEL